jgi:HAE1 family hydrophobic/amphiphilic exporter-1
LRCCDESDIHPIAILSGLAPAALGGLLTLWLFGNELNIYSFVGLILLMGQVMKNAVTSTLLKTNFP